MELLKKEGISPEQKMYVQLDSNLTVYIEIITKQTNQQHTWDFTEIVDFTINKDPEYFWAN